MAEAATVDARGGSTTMIQQEIVFVGADTQQLPEFAPGATGEQQQQPPQQHQHQQQQLQQQQQQQQLNEQTQQQHQTLTLHLRPRPSVTWSADVINNEGMGKKSSKRCCIFHKRRSFDESDSDESDSDADDEEREKRWAQPRPGRPKAHQLYHG